MTAVLLFLTLHNIMVFNISKRTFTCRIISWATPCSCSSSICVLTNPGGFSNKNIVSITGVGNSGAHTK